MDTAVPGRSETPAGAALFSLRRRTAVSKTSVARCGKDRDKDSVTSDLRLRDEAERSPRVSSFQIPVSSFHFPYHRSPITDHWSLVTDHLSQRDPLSSPLSLTAKKQRRSTRTATRTVDASRESIPIPIAIAIWMRHADHLRFSLSTVSRRQLAASVRSCDGSTPVTNRIPRAGL